MKYKINKNYEKKDILDFLKNDILENFDKIGEYVTNPGRNEIKKIFVTQKNFPKIINIKKFKKPNFISSIIYKFGKGTKAKRSFEYANMLLEKKIGTPLPIAYFEEFGNEKRDFYISENLEYDFTCREIFWPEDYKDVENENWYKKIKKIRKKVIKQFAKFTFKLHENGIEFSDYSPGNVLIIDKSGNYEFYLVDLNRMKFDVKMNLKKRMKNVSRMMEDEKLAKIFCSEYAKFIKMPEEIVFKKLNKFIKKHKNYVLFMDVTRPIRRAFKKKKIK